jgi:hemolysin activation/secretion protein
MVWFNLSASAGHTTSEAPQFEWLSLGGAESVRGFRRDDVLARTLLTLQPEVWVAVPGTTSSTSGAALYLRQHAHIALFTDVGAAWSTLGDLSGVKAGPGLGLRISQGPAVIKFDWARPFGSAATRAPHGRFYFNVQIKPRF